MTDTLETDRRRTLRRQLADGELVDAYGSDLRRTRIVRTVADRYLWCLSPILRDGDLGDQPGAAAPSIVAPHVVDGEYVYRTYGAQSLAKWLRVEDGDAAVTAVTAIDALMPALATLHGQPSPRPSTSPGLTRLTSWLDDTATVGPDQAGAAARLRRLAKNRWGDTGLRQMADWAQELACQAAPVHGNFSAGVIVPATTAGRTVVLAEPVRYTGAPELDLGWILGELIEHRTLRPGRAHAERSRSLQATVLRAYPGGWHPELVAIAATLRIATHARDFATLVGWSPALPLYLELCRGLIAAISAGNRAFLATNVLGVPTSTKGE